jgi:hypothetical protein
MGFKITGSRFQIIPSSIAGPEAIASPFGTFPLEWQARPQKEKGPAARATEPFLGKIVRRPKQKKVSRDFSPRLEGRGRTGCGKTLPICHSERSEESAQL